MERLDISGCCLCAMSWCLRIVSLLESYEEVLWPPEPGYIEVSCVEAAKIGVPDKGRHSILGDSGYLE